MRPMPLASLAVVLGLASTVSAQVKLELKHPEGRSSTYVTTVKSNQILTINGMDIETKGEEVATGKVVNGKQRPDGTQTQEKTVESIRAQVEANGQVIITFDSTNPNQEKPDNPMLAAIYQVLKAAAGAKFTVVLDKDGKVAAVEGTEKIADDKDLDDSAREMLKGRFSADRLKRANQQEYSTFPDILVREGEPWERTEVMDISGATLTFKRKYEYLGTVKEDGKTLDKIGVKATGVTYQTDPNSQSPVKVGKTDLKVEESDGTILFDREAGRLVKRSGKTRIKGDLDLEINGQTLPSKLDLTLETESHLEGRAK